MDIDIELQACLLLRDRITNEKSGVTEHTLKEPDTTHHTCTYTQHTSTLTCTHAHTHMYVYIAHTIQMHIHEYTLSFKLALPVSPFSKHLQCDWRG